MIVSESTKVIVSIGSRLSFGRRRRRCQTIAALIGRVNCSPWFDYYVPHKCPRRARDPVYETSSTRGPKNYEKCEAITALFGPWISFFGAHRHSHGYSGKDSDVTNRVRDVAYRVCLPSKQCRVNRHFWIDTVKMASFTTLFDRRRNMDTMY